MNTTAKQATTGSKKAAGKTATNSKTLETKGHRTNFDLVAVGVCPHCKSKLEKPIETKGTGQRLKCQSCQHIWYLNQAIKTCKCLTCSTERRNNPNKASSREVISKSLDAHAINSYNNVGNAGVAELADAADLKSAGAILVGSSPTLGTI